MANALMNVGVGAKIVKTSVLPVTTKFGVIVTGGISAGVITAGKNNYNSNNLPSYTYTNYSAKYIQHNLDV